MIRRVLTRVRDRVRELPIVKRWRDAHERARDAIEVSRIDRFLKRVKRDMTKKRFSPHGELPSTYEPLPPEEDTWVDVGTKKVLLSEILEYYARNYRWNPLEVDEHICIHFRDREAEKRFHQEQHRLDAIDFYKKAHQDE